MVNVGLGTNRARSSPPAELFRVLMLPDLERAERIGEFWSYPQSCTLRRAVDRPRALACCEKGTEPPGIGRMRAPLSNPLHVATAVVAERLPLSPRERLPVPRPIPCVRVEDSVGVGPEPVAGRRAEHLARP
jgi:hypothetical protein